MNTNTENNNISKCTVSFGLSLAACCVLNALLVVVKEKSPAVQGLMKKMTGHHWITHSVVVVVLFFLLGAIFGRLNQGRGPNMTGSSLLRIILSGVIVATLIIAGFYLFAD